LHKLEKVYRSFKNRNMPYFVYKRETYLRILTGKNTEK